jgi:hypothetical protein
MKKKLDMLCSVPKDVITNHIIVFLREDAIAKLARCNGLLKDVVCPRLKQLRWYNVYEPGWENAYRLRQLLYDETALKFKQLTHVDKFGLSLKDPKILMSWPHLKYLRFANVSDAPLYNVQFPPRLEVLILNPSYNRSLLDVQLPNSLRVLKLGTVFNHSIEHVKFPDSLQKLHLSWGFNQAIDRVVWPQGLKYLRFGWKFNQPIDQVHFPSGMTDICFGCCFNQPIDKVTWPTQLKRLSFGATFNQPLHQVVWPCRLTLLTLSHMFNHPLNQVRWPDSLSYLLLGANFNQAIKLPCHIKFVSFGSQFDREVDFPDSLEEITFVSLNRPVQQIRWPQSLKKLRFGTLFHQPLNHIQLPNPDCVIEVHRYYSHSMYHPQYKITYSN